MLTLLILVTPNFSRFFAILKNFHNSAHIFNVNAVNSILVIFRDFWENFCVNGVNSVTLSQIPLIVSIMQQKSKIALLVLAMVLLCSVPVSAIWTIQDPEYSGYVIFESENSGYAHIQEGIFSINQHFTYYQTGTGNYVALTRFAGKNYQIPFSLNQDRVTSPAFPNSSLIWVP